jgi:hypothetical protein
LTIDFHFLHVMWRNIFHDLHGNISFRGKWIIHTSIHIYDMLWRGIKLSRSYRNWDTNLSKITPLYRSKWYNSILVRIFQRFCHILDKIQVWTEYFVIINCNICRRRWSGKSLSMSMSLSLPVIFLFFSFFFWFSIVCVT